MQPMKAAFQIKLPVLYTCAVYELCARFFSPLIISMYKDMHKTGNPYSRLQYDHHKRNTGSIGAISIHGNSVAAWGKCLNQIETA